METVWLLAEWWVALTLAFLSGLAVGRRFERNRWLTFLSDKPINGPEEER